MLVCRDGADGRGVLTWQDNYQDDAAIKWTGIGGGGLTWHRDVAA